MAWIKRNLFFVIGAAVGLILTGYCSYLLYKSLGDNAGVSDDYKTTLSSLQDLQQKSPYPSKENVQAAKADRDRVHKFLADFTKRFEPFPAPVLTDEKGFQAYLDDTLVRFRSQAQDAGVLLPEDFEFAFGGLAGKLTYPPENIGPWMQQMEEIGSILNVLYQAKINALLALGRVPVSPDDTGSGLASAPVTNQWGVVTPYQITFRGFSAEIGAVLEGFARSSHCFIVRSLVINPDTTVQPMTEETAQPQGAVNWAPQYRSPAPTPRFDRYGPGDRHGPPNFTRQAPRYVQSPVYSYAAPAAPAGPVTILSENPLSVTITVDVIKLKASEH
jgi:hypothetical protein